MSSLSVVQCAGLHTSNNELSSVPAGALVEADNVIIRAKDVVEPRRGQRWEYTLPQSTDRTSEIFFFNGYPLVHFNDSKLAYPGGSGLLTYAGTYSAPNASLSRMKAVEAHENLYFATKNGVYRLDTLNGTPKAAGAPKTADMYGVLLTAGTSGFLQTSSKVAYRVVFCAKDAHGTLYVGSPSGRGFSTNASTTNSANVSVWFPVPSWVTTEHLYRVYRTAQVPANTDPGDEMGLVYEKQLTSDDLSNGYVSFTDATPDDFRGAPLHTNPNSGDGILQANEPPPFCYDLTYWNGRLWFANTRQPHRLYLDLLGISASPTDSGLRVGDRLTIAGVSYTGAIFQDFGTNARFQINSASTPSESIESTARNLVETINRNPANTRVRAYYISGPNDPPGKIVIEARDLDSTPITASLDTYPFAISSLSRSGGVVTVVTAEAHGLSSGDSVFIGAASPSSAFPGGGKTNITKVDFVTFTYVESGTAGTVTTGSYTVRRTAPSPSGAWNPDMLAGPASSSNDAAPNRLYYSKYQEPEAVPLLNYLDVGAKNRAILRIVPLRDKLFVFKEDGVFIVTGDVPFRVDLLDDTVRLVGPDTAVPVANQIYCLSNQGVVAVSEGGAAIVSRQIESMVAALMCEANLDLMRSVAFGVGHDTDHMYQLWLPNGASAVVGQALVYNTLLGGWTRWTLSRSCGRTNPINNTPYMGDAVSNKVFRESRTFTNEDYADDVFAISVDSSYGDPTLFQSSMASDVAPGDLISDADFTGAFGVVTSVDYVTGMISIKGNTIEISDQTPYLYVYKAIQCKVTWATVVAGDPGALKHFRELKLHFKKDVVWDATMTFATELAPAQAVPLMIQDGPPTPGAVGYGNFTYPTQKRLLVPQQQQRAAYLHLSFSSNQACAFWALNGFSLSFEHTSERTAK